MRTTVTYYDIDIDKAITKNCFEFKFHQKEDYFSFTPVDDPVTMYKSVIINSPTVSIGYSMYGLKMYITGWQMVKSGGYWTTETVIKIEDESI